MENNSSNNTNSLMDKNPWLASYLSGGGDFQDGIEVPLDDEENQEVGEEVNSEQGIPPEELAPPSEEPINQEVDKEEIKSEIINEPVKIKVTDYLQENRDKVREYLSLSTLDISSLTPEQQVRKKLERENPDFTSSEIDAELKDKYAIGLDAKKRSFDPDIHSEAEIKEIQEYNENLESQILKGQRNLKKDAKDAVNYLENLKNSIELPELSFETPKIESQSIDDYVKEEQKKQIKHHTEVWIPTIEKAISEVNSVSHSIGVEVTEGNKVVSDSDYQLSEKEKSQLKEYLKNYIGHPSDQKYFNETTQSYDVNKFVSDKAKEMFADSIIEFKVKELTTKFKQEFVKNELHNFDDSPRKVSVGSPEVEDFRMGLWNRQNKGRDL